MKKQNTGFTLIEVMITMVVVAIIAAIAIPSYSQHVQSAGRAEAKATLHEANQFMQRFYAMNNAYDQALDGTPVDLPDSLKQAPSQSDPRYLLSIIAPTPAAFTLQAAPTAKQGDDGCGTLTLSGTGRRTAALAVDPAAVARCWR